MFMFYLNKLDKEVYNVCWKRFTSGCKAGRGTVGNATKKGLELSETIDGMSRGSVAIESGRAVGSSVFKAASDFA